MRADRMERNECYRIKWRPIVGRNEMVSTMRARLTHDFGGPVLRMESLATHTEVLVPVRHIISVIHLEEHDG